MNAGIRSEITALIKKHGALTSAELFEKSELAGDRQHTYMAVYELKKTGELVTVDKRHYLPGDEPETVQVEVSDRPAPPVADASTRNATGFRDPDLKPATQSADSFAFEALLQVLLEACAESPDAGVRSLAKALQTQRREM